MTWTRHPINDTLRKSARVRSGFCVIRPLGVLPDERALMHVGWWLYGEIFLGLWLVLAVKLEILTGQVTMSASSPLKVGEALYLRFTPE